MLNTNQNDSLHLLSTQVLKLQLAIEITNIVYNQRTSSNHPITFCLQNMHRQPLDHEKILPSESINRILPFNIDMAVGGNKTSLLPYHLYLVQHDKFSKDEIPLRQEVIMKHYFSHALIGQIVALEQECTFQWGSIHYEVHVKSAQKVTEEDEQPKRSYQDSFMKQIETGIDLQSPTIRNDDFETETLLQFSRVKEQNGQSVKNKRQIKLGKYCDANQSDRLIASSRNKLKMALILLVFGMSFLFSNVFLSPNIKSNKLLKRPKIMKKTKA